MSQTHSAYSTPFLLNRAIFKLTGHDRLRYLNGQVTQDVHLASADTAIYSAITTVKGKMEGDLYIREHHGDLILDTPLELRESLFTRLEKYIIADDVELSDLSDTFSLTHQLATIDAGWSCHRFGIDGTEQLISKEEASSYQPADQAFLDELRIQQRIPLWGVELDTSTLPPEARIEQRAISYTKGCYTGQEVISRIRSAGKTNRLLEQFELSQPVELPYDFYVGTSSKPAGTITSICQIDDKIIALGYLSRKHSEQTKFHTPHTSIVKISLQP